MGKLEQTTTYFAAYNLGAMTGVLKVVDDFFQKAHSGEDAIYTKAAIQLITRDKDSMNHYLNHGSSEIGFRNHVRNKKGKLVSCEAYWMQQQNRLQSDK